MRSSNRTTRPPASEAAIREMHDRAAAADARAVKHEANADRIIAEANAGAQEMTANAERRADEVLTNAQKQADEHIEHARAMAAQMVANARAEAEMQRGTVRAEADENLRQAHLVAQQERDLKVAEEADRDYWAALAAEETGRAGLAPVAAPGPGGTLVASAQSAITTSTDGPVMQS